jgi:ubiquinone/menaquinone biosynthesis C-methylase UbiE
LKTLLPAVGGVLSGAPSAYRYLSDTVDSYRSADELRALAEVAGWKAIRHVRLAMGTVAILSGGAVDS